MLRVITLSEISVWSTALPVAFACAPPMNEIASSFPSKSFCEITVPEMTLPEAGYAPATAPLRPTAFQLPVNVFREMTVPTMLLFEN